MPIYVLSAVVLNKGPRGFIICSLKFMTFDKDYDKELHQSAAAAHLSGAKSTAGRRLLLRFMQLSAYILLSPSTFNAAELHSSKNLVLVVHDCTG